MMQLHYPYRFDGLKRTATAGQDRHIRDMIEQVLFTSPGERVNRPTFGSGLRQLVFDPSGAVLANATQLAVHGALQQWLGEVIAVEAVRVEAVESALRVTVQYVVRRSQERRADHFSR